MCLQNQSQKNEYDLCSPLSKIQNGRLNGRQNY